MLCLFPVSAYLLTAPVLAQDQGKEAPEDPASPGSSTGSEELLRTIEEQQMQLEEQRERLERQQKMLLELQQQVQGLIEAEVPEPAPATGDPESTPAEGAGPRSADTRATVHQGEPPRDEWPGSLGLAGSNTRLKIGGFAQLDVIHDSDAIATPCEFVTSAIVTREPSKADGADGRTSLCVNASRLWLETRTPTTPGRLNTYVSVDFFGDSTSTSPDLRLREAYGELRGFRPGEDLLAGQAWSTFSDVAALPDTLDYEGPNSSIQSRQPLVPWTKRDPGGASAMVAVETPDSHQIAGADADSLTRWPDLVVSVAREHDGGHLRGGAVIRDLRASSDDGATETALGWGVSGSGKAAIRSLGDRDNMTFQVTYGEGVGSYFDDFPPDAVFDGDTSSLETLPVFGAYVGMQHWWTESLSPTAVYGSLDVSNLGIQPADALDKTRYLSANVVWRPHSQFLFGAEYLWGSREDKDGARGTDNRIQLTSKLSF